MWVLCQKIALNVCYKIARTTIRFGQAEKMLWPDHWPKPRFYGLTWPQLFSILGLHCPNNKLPLVALDQLQLKLAAHPDQLALQLDQFKAARSPSTPVHRFQLRRCPLLPVVLLLFPSLPRSLSLPTLPSLFPSVFAISHPSVFFALRYARLRFDWLRIGQSHN